MEKELEPQADSAAAESPQASEIFKEGLILASASPRRREILQAVGWPFETLAVDVDESRLLREEAVAYVERLARKKVEAAAKERPRRLVIGADTVVVVDGQILGKPLDEVDARRMLRLLSGRWHEVLTGVALLRGGNPARHLVAHEKTEVRFKPMTATEINWYVATREPLDKAGAYAIQGRAALFIEEIRGDYWNVVGLPVQLVYKLAREI
jgi:septum formation protein